MAGLKACATTAGLTPAFKRDGEVSRETTMHLFKKHISRRTVLKGVGATVALPLLDAMSPASTAWAKTAAGTSPKRMAFHPARPALPA